MDDPDEAPRIALGVAKRRNRELLRDLLDGYDVVRLTGQVLSGTDLCLVDAAGFDQHRDALIAWKRSEQPLTAPVLLVANAPEDELWARYGGAVGESLDAVLSVPAPRRAVRTRVDGLVQAREQARLAAARYDRLELYERAMDGAQVGITIADATRNDLPMVYVNDGFCELTGYTESRRKPTTSVLSFTHTFTESQTDVSDAFEPDLYSDDRGEDRFGR
jgi:PAS domain-containing protein